MLTSPPVPTPVNAVAVVVTPAGTYRLGVAGFPAPRGQTVTAVVAEAFFAVIVSATAVAFVGTPGVPVTWNGVVVAAGTGAMSTPTPVAVSRTSDGTVGT